tara:strand:- start:432 stop:686 length:255 start_codon:yes stop_codon:yes gene_type:complete
LSQNAGPRHYIDKRLSEQDLLTHEQSIGIIIHYLKNALDHQSLEKIAFQDFLTGIMNRTALEELLPKEIERTQRYQFDHRYDDD